MNPCIEPELVARADTVVAALKEGGLMAVTAESCTGGLVVACLAHAEDASAALHGGFVTYSKEQKAAALGVERSLLDQEGSVSGPVAAQMAQGALQHSPADIAIAVTGVLGPSPDEDGNPVGLVYLACCRKGRAPSIVRKTYGLELPDALRRRVVLDALDLMQDCIRQG